ncbi:MAG: hypothetical protein RIC35_14980 [Marinoscillum sp.]
MINLEKEQLLNYAYEEIPSRAELIDKCNLWVEKALNLPKYSFSELFKEVPIKGKTENHRNLAIWGELYNNWSKESYDAEGSPLHLNKPKNEVKGIYIFYENGTPVYTGISRKIVQRLRNHFTGTTHFQATLAYLILRDQHDKSPNGLYKEKREKLPEFINHRPTLQEQMKKDWKIAILPISCNYELYVTEVLLACELRTKWNSFETH